MYIQSLAISNLRCFRNATLMFQYPERADGAALPNINLVLGNNGGGKSTVLRAIALALLSPVIANSGFRPYRLVRRAPGDPVEAAEIDAQVLLHGPDLDVKDKSLIRQERVTARIRRIRDSERMDGPPEVAAYWDNMYDDRSPAFFVVGYGASRRVENSSSFDASLRAKSRQLRYQRVASLFEEQVTLTPLGAWLPQLRSENPGRYKQVIHLINDLLPPECRFQEAQEDGEFVFEHRGSPVPFAALSDGYRAYISWITDLLYHVLLGAPSGAKLRENRGIVLVDEIDLHLHPEWQRTVVPRLAAALPNLQFVLTTHSPIVTGTLQAENIFVSEPDDTGASAVHQLRERVHGLSAEQILLSSYFNLETTRAPAAEDELTQLARAARAGDPNVAVAYLRKLAEGASPDPPPPARTRKS